MNRDYDDDLEYDIEDDEDEHPDLVPDGHGVRVGIMHMDSLQRAISQTKHLSSFDDAHHRPGWRTPSHVTDSDVEVGNAYAERSAWLRDAHRAHRTPVVADAKPARRPKSLQDAQQAAETAYQEMCQFLRDAHRQGRQP